MGVPLNVIDYRCFWKAVSAMQKAEYLEKEIVYETYKDRPELSTLLRENTWSNNMHIISKTKSYEEKEFYLKLASKEKYKAKELARQIDNIAYIWYY